ncbi:hypothetical protein QBC32DRAFT_184981, partial [Pseudoneurospora amorphoporcata]
EYLPQEKTAIIMNGLDPRTLTRFVETLKEDGYLNIDNDDLFIDAVDRVLIMALAFQQLANPAELKLPPDVIDKCRHKTSWFQRDVGRLAYPLAP